VASGFFPRASGLVFWLVISNQAVYKTLKHPIDNPSFKVLYQPLRKDQRLSTQIAVETLVTPLTIGLAGGLMLLFTRVIPYDPVVFSWLMLAVFFGWALVANGAGREYAEALVNALKRRVVDDEPFTYGDARSMAVLYKTLESDQPADVLFALDLLEKAHVEELTPALVRLIEHPAPEVRRSALERLETLGAREALPAVAARATLDPIPAVRAVALRAMCALGGEDAWSTVVVALDDASPDVRRGAMVGLLRTGHAAARARLTALAASASASDRAWAARVAGESQSAALVPVLGALLRDSSPLVRRAALAAASRLGQEGLWPAVADALGDRRLRSAAASALVAGGEGVVDVLAPFLGGEAAGPVAREAARILGRAGGARAQAVLREHIAYPDQLVRLEVLESLRLLGYAAGEQDAGLVRRQLHEELNGAAWSLAALRDLPEDDPSLVDLRAALVGELQRSREAVLLLLSFLYDPVAIVRAREGLVHGSKEKRAYALEVLDVTVDGDIRPRVLAVMEDRAPAEASRLLDQTLTREVKTPRERVREAALRPRAFVSAWTTACAVRAAAALGGDGWDAAVASALDDGHRVVRETAAWAASRLGAAGGQEGGNGRMLTIERVICLKAVPMFAEASEEILADVAELLEEVEAKQGQVVFEKGAAGDSLYIVLSGRVRVYDGARTIVELGEKEIFGELALLDPEPRVASVAAVEDTRLFRLDREAFAELMAGNIEIVRGVLHVLCERLRTLDSYPMDRRPLDRAAQSV
jgi:HEAT repeat protein